MALTASAVPASFADATPWNLPSQGAVPVIDSAGGATLRQPGPDVGAVVGLEGPEGLVALAVLPPGLDAAVGEVRISPLSTAFTLVALHPALAAGDHDTQIARLARAATHPSLALLAEAVDGRELSSWGSIERDLIETIVADSVVPGPIRSQCLDNVAISGALSRCGTQLLNAATDSLLVAGADGAPCALVPPITEIPTAGASAAIVAVIARAEVTAAELGTVVADPGTTDGSGCGDEPRLVVENDPTWIATSTAFRMWADDAASLARYLGSAGASIDTNERARSLLLGRASFDDGTPSAGERLRAAVRENAAATSAGDLGILPLSADAAARLDQLANVLEAVYG
ncbi:MAG: hypothetical protein AAF567_14130 [Actinomycetota bacterium]